MSFAPIFGGFGSGGGAVDNFETLVNHDFGTTAQQDVEWDLTGHDYFIVRCEQISHPGVLRFQFAISGPTWRTSGYERAGVSGGGDFSEQAASGEDISGATDTEVNYNGALYFAGEANYFTTMVGDAWIGGGAAFFGRQSGERMTAEVHTRARLRSSTGNITAGKFIVIGVTH